MKFLLNLFNACPLEVYKQYPLVGCDDLGFAVDYHFGCSVKTLGEHYHERFTSLSIFLKVTFSYKCSQKKCVHACQLKHLVFKSEGKYEHFEIDNKK